MNDPTSVSVMSDATADLGLFASFLIQCRDDPYSIPRATRTLVGPGNTAISCP